MSSFRGRATAPGPCRTCFWRGPIRPALAPAGVGWLVVESDSAGDMGAAARTLGALTPVYRDHEFALYRIGGGTPGASPARRAATLIAHLAWLAMLLVGAAGAVVCRWRAPTLKPRTRHADGRRRGLSLATYTTPLTKSPACTDSSTLRIASALCVQENSPLRVCALAPS